MLVYLSIYFKALSNKNINTLTTYSNEKGRYPITHFLVKMLTYILFLYISGVESGLISANQRKVTFGFLQMYIHQTNILRKELGLSVAEQGDPIMVGFIIPMAEISSARSFFGIRRSNV